MKFQQLDLLNTIRTTLATEASALQKLSEFSGNDYIKVIQEILNGRSVVVTGIGKSGIIAQKWVATFNSTGQPAQFLHAAEAIHGDLGLVLDDALVFCLSKSGNSPEIQFLINLLKLRSAFIVGVGTNRSSHLAENAHVFIQTPMEKEACPNNLAPTVSTTLQLAVGDAFAVALMTARNFKSEDFARHHPGGALGKNLFTRVGDLMRKNSLAKVELNSNLHEVLIEISGKRVGATLVIENELTHGIITDGDVRRFIEKNTSLNLNQVHASDLLNPNPSFVDREALAVEAYQMMEIKKINQLVVKEQNKPVGFIHIHDILSAGIK
ncbi:MAG: SIS domain-containing protein [Bacteroidota bacterium]